MTGSLALRRIHEADCREMHSPIIVRKPIARAELISLASEQFGDMIKAVVDVERRIMALGGELHSDEEALLIDHGSLQRDVWGINLYPALPTLTGSSTIR